MREGNRTCVKVDGRIYPSIFKAAVEIGCNYSWLWCRLRAGQATIKGRHVTLAQAENKEYRETTRRTKMKKAMTITLTNCKGGTGKTSLTTFLAEQLLALGKKVLIVDADPQANATSGLGVDFKKMSSSIYECLVDDYPISGTQVPTCVKGLDIIGSRIDLVGAELELINKPNRERVMARLLEQVRDQYDYILIDCSPSLGLITVNALTAADSVIIPVQAEYFALEGISKLLNTIRIIKSKLNQHLEIEGFLLTMYDARLRLANQIYEELKTHFGTMVFDTVIPRNTRLSEAPSHGLPAILYDPTSRGATSHLQLARELIARNRTRKSA